MFLQKIGWYCMADMINYRDAKEDKEMTDCLRVLTRDVSFGPVWTYVNLFHSPYIELSDPRRHIKMRLDIKQHAKIEGDFELCAEKGLMPSFQASPLRIVNVPEPEPGVCYLVSPEVALGLLLKEYPTGSFGIPIKRGYDGYHGVCHPTCFSDILMCLIKRPRF